MVSAYFFFDMFFIGEFVRSSMCFCSAQQPVTVKIDTHENAVKYVLQLLLCGNVMMCFETKQKIYVEVKRKRLDNKTNFIRE